MPTLPEESIINLSPADTSLIPKIPSDLTPTLQSPAEFLTLNLLSLLVVLFKYIESVSVDNK